MDDLHPSGKPHESLIQYVTDRPGHDARYAIDATKLETELAGRHRRILTAVSKRLCAGTSITNGGGRPCEKDMPASA